jgi:excisionase family DNA binding protein
MDSRPYTQAPFVTVQQVSDAFGGAVPTSTLYRRIDDGTIPHWKLGGRLYVPRSWVDSILEGASGPAEQ